MKTNVGGKQIGSWKLEVVTYLKALPRNLPSEITKTQETSSEVVAKPVGIRLSTSGTGVSNLTTGPHVGISLLYCMRLLSHITDFNLYNRYIIVKL